MRYARLVAIAALGIALGAPAAADGGFLCRWLPGTTRIGYGAFEAKDAAGTQVRALMQGALLAEASGALPRFADLSQAVPVRESEALVCADPGVAPADGTIELTFTRKVRLGIEYTLARCELYYRCAASDPAAAAPAEPIAPEPLLDYLAPRAGVCPDRVRVDGAPSAPLAGLPVRTLAP